ncbi:tetratricopeptide repeat protein [Marinicellulosiphila megalodicopiae]|uniref:tetratricopeptide repeat protein n=1 Tax=Marinicellulosiphila megalodicopiae TaxID=2724896 RepID=UPI003BB083E6
MNSDSSKDKEKQSLLRVEEDSVLANILLDLNLVTETQIDFANDKIMQGDPRHIGSILVEEDHISKSKLITTIVKYINLPKAQTMLEKKILQRQQRNKNVIGKGIENNVSPYVMDDSKVKQDLYFHNGNVEILGPELDITPFKKCKMDELQVAQMALMLLAEQQWEETEEYLIEAIHDFPQSVILRYQIIWLYNVTGFQIKAIEHIRLIENQEVEEVVVFELLAWTMLKNKKYLEAIRLYQQLSKSEEKQSIWFYLLAYCLYQEKLYKQARKVFSYFLTLGYDSNDVINNANQYLEKIQGQL